MLDFVVLVDLYTDLLLPPTSDLTPEEEQQYHPYKGIIASENSSHESKLQVQSDRNRSSSTSASSPCPSCTNLTSSLLDAHCQIADLQTRLTQSESKLAISIRQNGILIRNLSQLFQTAQAEIQKYKQQLDEAKGVPSASTATPSSASRQSLSSPTG